MEEALRSRGLGPGQDPCDIGPAYLVNFGTPQPAFRLGEFTSAAEYLDIDYCFVPLHINAPAAASSVPDEAAQAAAEPASKLGMNPSRPFMLVHLPSDDAAQRLADRATSIRSIWAHWVTAPSLAQACEVLQHDPDVRSRWTPYRPDHISWRATVWAHFRTLFPAEQLERIEAFASTLDFLGPIRMKAPDMEWGYFEEWTRPVHVPATAEELASSATYVVENGWSGGDDNNDGDDDAAAPRQRLLAVHVARKVTDGRARHLIAAMDVKQRAYIGNTTMEAHMSLVQAVMALAGPGKIVYDPFAGTGSLLYAAAKMGAYVMASDIDARMMKGKIGHDGSTGIMRSARQYGVQHLVLDCLGCDMTQHPWRFGGLFDAIVADPPYGIRAGAKRLGRRDESKQRSEAFLMPDGTYSHQRPDYVPPSKPYPLDDLIADLLRLSATLLKPRGRLVFWVPTMTEGSSGEDTYQQQPVQLPPSPDFRLVSHAMQDFGTWGRRLITLEKLDAEQRAARQQGDDDAAAAIGCFEAPSGHLAAATSKQDKQAEQEPQKEPLREGKVRADADPNEFRNKVREYALQVAWARVAPLTRP